VVEFIAKFFIACLALAVAGLLAGLVLLSIGFTVAASHG
jgi:hypothetical protein